MPSTEAPLSGWVIADLSTGIAGGYCTKILADGGAEVVKIEAPEGDPLRSWSASGAPIPNGDDGALFQFLSTSKRSVVADPGLAADLDYVGDLLERADVVVWSQGSRLADAELLHPASALSAHPHLTVTSITPFGLEGPWRDRPASEFTLQAWSGGVIGLGRGDPNRAPTFVGGQVGAWLAGAYAAVGTMVSRLRNEGRGSGEIVDVSMLEAMASCLTYYPVTYFDVIGRPFRGRRSIVTPGVGMAKDGMIAVGVGTGQQWLDFCVMVDHPEWMEDKSLFRERSHLSPTIDEWFAAHTVDEIRDLATAFRLPNAPIANGANLPRLDHFEARGTFVESPRGGFLQPGAPWRMHPARLRPPEAAPLLGEHGRYRPHRTRQVEDARPPEQASASPFHGLRVLDMTAFWAGPSCTHPLAMLGAEVIHLESTSRPDGTRMLGAPLTEQLWWERSPIFSGLNTNKKSLTLDFQSERGMQLLHRLIATTDVIVENYTPRVLDQAGLSFEVLRSIRSDIVLVRMPGFGLDGPWRDNAAFAYTIEDASGFTWMTGYGDQKPLEPYCVGDPNAGIHALFGLLLALEHRRRTGEAVAVEAAMVDAAVNVTAEQVIEYSAYGSLLERAGNRGPTAAPQNLYRTTDTDERGGNDCWVAIAVASDDEWEALTSAIGNPDWADDAALSTAAGRANNLDLIDDHLAAWCAARAGDEIVELLWPAGVTVAKVVQPHRQGEVPQLVSRGYFEVVEHPVSGAARHSTLPMRFSKGPHQLHLRHAPLLGEHNGELLAELGLTEAEITALEADGVIGRAPAGSDPAQARR
jgi:crotonobetainyl-CoA:carnitine CoA-transferase CaiB-like acyl-CoA transferase